MNGCMGIFRTVRSLGAIGGRGKGGTCRDVERQTDCGRQEVLGLCQAFGDAKAVTRGSADCGQCQVTSCLHALGYASYII